MKEICYNCKYKGVEWKNENEIPEHHCQHESARQQAIQMSLWASVRSIFESCGNFERKDK
jgi:hypothetical protein